ncbi:phosphonate ABC transporter substrate-binding protein (plasmid) [Pseudorhodobacter turbinis]|uniref:Phosphonate ABC transporter substrate-binding protein n=1 Tax=Pseudorhodobacter turbinis TaxID=2500533 RepID=A0A4P8EL01_9RHOB|nr:PhnD/SsuA/transferrin family substrate-binding protein [Pseudorhodobacter turbinis]QCO57552.1 phosphonate ABC transporter substrate-binding protein [Pseudorhodobacter turbinis]
MKGIVVELFTCVARYKRCGARWARAVVAATVAAVLATSAMADINLVFGTYAADKPTQTVKMYRPFLQYLAHEMTDILGEPVHIKMRVAKEYETSIEHLAVGDVDFSRFGPASYITVFEQNSGIQIIAMESNKGSKRFKGVIAVHADSPIQSLRELRNKSFAFGDQLSTIGRYLAQSHLIRAGITSKELSGYDYLGRHDRVGAAVGVGRFTAGALKEDTMIKLIRSGVPIRPMFEFENVTKPWLAAAGMDPAVLAAMRQVMLEIKDAELLGDIAEDGFLEGSDADYDFIRHAMNHSKGF